MGFQIAEPDFGVAHADKVFLPDIGQVDDARAEIQLRGGREGMTVFSGPGLRIRSADGPKGSTPWECAFANRHDIAGQLHLPKPRDVRQSAGGQGHRVRVLEQVGNLQRFRGAVVSGYHGIVFLFEDHVSPGAVPSLMAKRN